MRTTVAVRPFAVGLTCTISVEGAAVSKGSMPRRPRTARISSSLPGHGVPEASYTSRAGMGAAWAPAASSARSNGRGGGVGGDHRAAGERGGAGGSGPPPREHTAGYLALVPGAALAADLAGVRRR